MENIQCYKPNEHFFNVTLKQVFFFNVHPQTDFLVIIILKLLKGEIIWLILREAKTVHQFSL